MVSSLPEQASTTGPHFLQFTKPPAGYQGTVHSFFLAIFDIVPGCIISPLWGRAIFLEEHS